MSSKQSRPSDIDIDIDKAPVAFRSLSDALQQHAARIPEQLAYVFLGDGEHQSGSRTFAELDRDSRIIAAALRTVLDDGDRVLLLYSDGLDFVSAFFGCLYAGIIPVPAYPPLRGKRLSSCANIARQTRARAVLTTRDLIGALRKALNQDELLSRLPIIPSDTCQHSDAAFQPKACAPSDIALIQYTSGTTGQPKGVVVTHGNLVNNEQAVELAFEHDAQTVFAGWLPLFHDMGLIGNVLQPLHLGTPAILMPPAAFLQQPVRWLNAISRYRATTSGAPNFAYELCAARVTTAQKAKLDLSSWKVAFNGAEPLRPETLQRFAQAFAGCGFSERAHLPCYGMAEATLFVAGAKRGEQTILTVDAAALERRRVEVASDPTAAGSKQLVACGAPRLGNELRVVDPQTHAVLPPGRVGELWLRGPSVTAGYHADEVRTRAVYGARLRTTPAGRHWLRTGDLGFIHAGQLYVAGRLRDVLRIGVRTLYPQDIELTAERSHAHVAKGRVAAFALEGEDAQLVVLAEVDFAARAHAEARSIASAISQAVAQEHAIELSDVRVLSPSKLAITSSGKVQRRRNRELYQRGELSELSPN